MKMLTEKKKKNYGSHSLPSWCCRGEGTFSLVGSKIYPRGLELEQMYGGLQQTTSEEAKHVSQDT